MYVVVFGRLRALLPGDGSGDQVLGEIRRGEPVGEMALVTGKRRSATVIAVRDTELIKVTKEAFEQLVHEDPAVMLDLLRVLVDRYQRAIRPPCEQQPVTIAVVPCTGDRAANVFRDGLVAALSTTSRVWSLDIDALRRYRSVHSAALLDTESAELAGWLHDQELRHDFVVYTAEPTISPWTRLCIRQADVVLLVGTTDASSHLDSAVHDLFRTDFGTGARRELVLLYDARQGMPSGAASWLSQLQVSDHHHVDPYQTADIERLARLLTGRAIGLVLGGGGARGVAHIGILRALEEARIPVDLVGGTSIGAVIGGQIAQGWNSSRVLAESRKAFLESGSLHDYTVPLIALLRGRRFFDMLGRLFGDRRIEDSPIGYFCISTNLTQSTCMVHRAGSLRKWVAASMAVPGIGPPIFDGRDVLVDGGVVNNLPIDIMRGLKRGPVFASDVSPRVELQLDREYQDIPSPWSVLLSHLSPASPPMQVPRIGSILMRTVSLMRRDAGVDEHDGADLVFTTPHGGRKLLEWQAFDEIVETGYRTAVAAIERWQARSGHRPPEDAD